MTNSIFNLWWFQPLFIAILTIIGAFVLGGIFRLLITYFEGKKNKFFVARVLDALEEPVIYLSVLFGLYIAVNELTHMSGFVMWLSRIFYFLFVMGVAWLAIRIVHLLIDYFIVKKFEDRDEGRRILFVSKVAQQVLGSFLWVMALVLGLDNAGVDVSALLAGMGISGLAFSLAAKDLASNIFGGFSVFFDQLFKLGDNIKIKGFEGKVNYVGPRITQIVDAKNQRIMIPNSNFASNPVVVLSEEVPAQYSSHKLRIGVDMSLPVSDVSELLLTLRNHLLMRLNEEDSQLKIYLGEQNGVKLCVDIRFLLPVEGIDRQEMITDLKLDILSHCQEKQISFVFLTSVD